MQRYPRIDVVTPPASEPITIEQARAQCRVVAFGSPDPTSPDDDILTAQSIAAREYVEHEIGYALITQSLRATLDQFPWNGRRAMDYRWHQDEPIVLRGVGIAVSSVVYTDDDGADQTLDPTQYQIDVSGGGARIWPAYGTCWPVTRCQPAAVRVLFTAGYAADNVPESLRRAILLVVGDLYANREASTATPGLTVVVSNPAVDALLFQHRAIAP